MTLHASQQCKMFCRVKEHTTYNLSQNSLSSASDTGIIQQMTLLIFTTRKQIIRQPTNQRTLLHTGMSLKKLNTTKDTSILVLPTTSRSKQLFQNQSTVAYFILIPLQATEIGYRAKHRRS